MTLLATVPDGSCAEYFFAGSLQGDTNGCLCADVMPQLQNGILK